MTRGKIYGLLAALLMAMLTFVSVPGRASAASAVPVDTKLGSLSTVVMAAAAPDGKSVYAAASASCAGSSGGTVTCYKLWRVYSNAADPSVAGTQVQVASLAGRPTALTAGLAGNGIDTVLAVAESNAIETFVVQPSSTFPLAAPSVTVPVVSTATPATAIPATPLAIATSNSTIYALLGDAAGTLVTFAATGGTVPVTTLATGVTFYTGGFVVAGGDVYVGQTVPGASGAASTGQVAQVPTSGGPYTPPASGGSNFAVVNLGSNLPNSLASDSSASYLYVGGSLGLTAIDLSNTANSNLVVYPGSGISCSQVSFAQVGPSESYLYCTSSALTDAHVYRFDASAPIAGGGNASSLTRAWGVPITKHAIGVVGATWGVYLLVGGSGTATFTTVGNASITSTLQLQSFPQPPSNVHAYARMAYYDPDNNPATPGTVYGPVILATWTAPASDHTITKFSAVGNNSGKFTNPCTATYGDARAISTFPYGASPTPPNVNDYYCIITGLTAGVPYTVTVSSQNDVGSSAPIPAATPVSAGTPMPPGVTFTSDNNHDGAPDDPGDPGTLTTLSTYKVIDGATIQVTWPAFDPQVSGSNGVNPISSYVATAVDTSSSNGSGKSCSPDPTASTYGTAANSATSCTITGLTAGKTYRVVVAANNTPIPVGATSVKPATAWTGSTVTAVPDTTQHCADDTAPTPAFLANYVPGVTDPTNPHVCTSTASYTAAGQSSTSYIDPTFVAGASPPPNQLTAVPGVSSINVGWTGKSNFGPTGLNVASYTATATYTDPLGKVTTKTCTANGYLATGCTVTGLTNGLPYTVSVAAKGKALGPAAYVDNVDNTNPTVTTPDGKPDLITPVGPPAAPTKPTVAVPAYAIGSSGRPVPLPGTAVISWAAPTDNGGAPIQGYVVTATLSPAPVIPDNSLQCGTGIAPDYQGVVTTWTTGYTIPAPPATPAPPPTSCTLTGLDPQATYTVTVVGYNTIYGTAGGSKASAATSKFSPYGAPHPPTKVTAVAGLQPGTLVASWTAPASNGGSGVTSYEAQAWTVSTDPTDPSCLPTAARPACAPVPDDPSTLSTTEGSCKSTMATCTISGLTNGTPYLIQVRAFNTFTDDTVTYGSYAGTAAVTPVWSAYSGSSVPYDKPDAPTIIDDPSLAQSTRPADKSVYVVWALPLNTGGVDPTGASVPLISYTATATFSGTTKSCTTKVTLTPTVGTVPGTAACTISGLTNGVDYSITVTASNAAKTSMPSTPDIETPGTVPGTPGNVQVSVSTNSAQVWWTAPTSTGGNPITQYTVTAVPGGISCQAATPAGCTLAGLTNGQAYTVSVVATNQFGDSPPTPASTPFVPMGFPAQPTHVQAFPALATPGQVTVTWNAPTDNGGGTIQSYIATARPVTAGTALVGTCTTTYTPAVPATKTTPATPEIPAPTSCTMTGVTNGQAYRVTVVAANAAGKGPASAQSDQFTPLGPPGAPVSVFAYSDVVDSGQDGSTTVHVTWSAPDNDGGASILEYVATASPGGQQCTDDLGAGRCDITGLLEGTNYTITVVAKNTYGTSAPSAPSPPVGPAGLPATPTGVFASAAGNGVTIDWRAADGNGANITAYWVLVSPGERVVKVSGDETSTIITGLTFGLPYTFQVEAWNPVGHSGLSKPTPKVKVTGVPGRVQTPRLRWTKHGRSFRVVVSWNRFNNGVRRYVIRRIGGSRKIAGPRADHVIFTVPKAGRYAFTVQAVNGKGAGPASPAATIFVGVPGR